MRNEKCKMRNELARNAEREVLSENPNSELRTQNFIPRRASRVLFFGGTERGHGGEDGTKIPLRHLGKTDLIQQCGALSAKRLV